jgi:hypothetical protein
MVLSSELESEAVIVSLRHELKVYSDHRLQIMVLCDKEQHPLTIPGIHILYRSERLNASGPAPKR